MADSARPAAPRLGSPPLSDRATLRPVVSPTASPVPSPAVPLRTPEVHRPEVRPEVRPEGRPEQAVVEKSPSRAGRSPTPPVPEQIDLPWTRLASEALEPVPQLSGRQEGASRAEAKKLCLGGKQPFKRPIWMNNSEHYPIKIYL